MQFCAAHAENSQSLLFFIYLNDNSSLGRYNDALSQYKYTLTLDPDNAVALQGIQTVAELEKKKQQAKIEQERQMAQTAMSKQQQQQKSKEEKNGEKQLQKQQANDEEEGEEDDLLRDFFGQVEQATTKPTSSAATEEKAESNSSQNEKQEPSKLQVTLSDLGTSEEQINRLLQTNYEWRNLNPYYVLDISDPHNIEWDMVQKRYKALSLLVHPDKCPNDIQRARDAFEHVNKAMKALQDEDKRKHILGLIEAGKKQARREWDSRRQQRNGSAGGQQESLEQLEEKSIMKIFAEIEMKRRDVERRQREYEQRERTQEDEELKRQQMERDFDKNWRNTERVAKRVGNWREFQQQSSHGASDSDRKKKMKR